MKTAVVYARYSCDNQTEQSIEGQLRVCEQFAKNNDIVIVNTYIDRAMTGTNDQRPSFQKMLKDSTKKEWNYVLVYKLDRFSRNKYESVIHKKTLKENGIKVLSAMENIPDTPEGIILESLLEGMNQYYSADLSQKIKRGMNETRIKGYFQGGNLLYGYKLDGRKIVIDEEQAETVRYIFQQYAIGVYAKDIVIDLTVKNILFKGKPFSTYNIYSILGNSKYSGKYYHEEQLIENMYPKIVPDELFAKVQTIIEKNRYGKRSIKIDYLLSGKLKCGHCGLPITADSVKNKQGKKFFYYKCSGRKKKLNDCKKTTIAKDKLEKFIVDKIIEKLNEPELMDKIVKKLLLTQEQQQTNNQELAILQRQKKQLENVLENLARAIEQGVITKTTTERLKSTEDKIEALEQQILIKRSESNSKLTEKTIREYYNKALSRNARLLISALIKVITVYDDRIEITLNSPIKNSPDDNGRGFLFYTEYNQIQPMQNINQTIKTDYYLWC
ncbi:MAG: recombinase family protein [Clostridia bacterium]|nr:recombinase family protein [Clostridia bacterium]